MISDPFNSEKFKETQNSLISADDILYYKYSKLKIVSLCELNNITHGETECGHYFWMEILNGKVVMCIAETAYEIGEYSEVVLNYYGNKPSLSKIIKHMNWDIDENNIWIN